MTGMSAEAGAEFELFRLSSYAKSLVPNERDLYVRKLAEIDCDDPYVFPPDVWKTRQLPNINEHDVFNHLIAKHSETSGLEIRAYKAIRDAEQYVTSGWVKDVYSAKLTNNIVITTTRVHHSQAIRKTLCNPWSAIANDNSIISSHCDCAAG